MRDFINSAEVAHVLEYRNTQMFYRHRETLMRDHGFPAPVPMCTRELKWRRADVERWKLFAGKAQPNGIPALNGTDARNVINFHEAAKVG